MLNIFILTSLWHRSLFHTSLSIIIVVVIIINSIIIIIVIIILSCFCEECSTDLLPRVVYFV